MAPPPDRVDAVPDFRSGGVRCIHPVDRFRPGLPGLARLLWQREPAGCACADQRSASAAAFWPGHPYQGLDRDGAPLSGHGSRCADFRFGTAGLAASYCSGCGSARLAPAAGDAGVGLRAGRVWRTHRDDEVVSGHRHPASARWRVAAGHAGGAVRATGAFWQGYGRLAIAAIHACFAGAGLRRCHVAGGPGRLG